MIERESFLFYRAYLNAANRMNTEQKAKFYELIFAYGLDGKVPKDTGDALIDMALDFVRPLLGANIKNYLNGSKGGAPVGNQNARKNNPKTTENNRQTTTKQPNSSSEQGNVKDNVKVNVKDNDNVNENDKDNVNVNDKESVPHYSDDPERNAEIIREMKRGAILLPDGSLDYSNVKSSWE